MAERFFIADDEREPELRQLRRVLDSLGKTAELSRFDEPVPLDVLLAHLEQALARERTRRRISRRQTYLLHAQADASGALPRRLSRRDERHRLSAP